MLKGSAAGADPHADGRYTAIRHSQLYHNGSVSVRSLNGETLAQRARIPRFQLSNRTNDKLFPYDSFTWTIMLAESENWLSVCAFISLNLVEVEKFRNILHAKKVYECYCDIKIRNKILTWIESYPSKNKFAGKSAEESNRLRNLGNQKYAKGDLEGSLRLYTKSIIHAPHDSREMLLALGNRSAASFRLRHYEDCIADINFAIENFKNETVLPKLLTRKHDALKKLEKHNAKLSSNESGDDFIGKNNNSSCKLKSFSSKLPTVSRGLSKFFPFASSLLELESNSSDHRRVVANENIEVGEILFVEDPFTFVLLPDYFRNYCQFCSTELRCPIACSDCNDFLFCNQTCFKQAYDTFHKWECYGSRMVQDTGVGFLALRTLLKASQDPFSFHYEQVNDLETHLDDVPVDDLILFTLTAAMLLLYLEKYTDFFTCSSARKSVDGVGFRLLKHIIQIICNAFAAKKSNFKGRLDEDSFETCLTTFSTGLYPSAAMMNHSCDPNIITSFYDNILIVRASQQIGKGEEVFNCYGPHYCQEKTQQRKEILKNQFYFDCKCKQCCLNEKITNFLCSHCGSPCLSEGESETELKCISCDKLYERQKFDEFLQKANRMKETGYQYLSEGNLDKALAIFEKTYNYLLGFMDYSSPEVEICSLDVDSCHQCLGSWRYIGERTKRIKTRTGKYSLQYGEFLRHSLSSYLMSLSMEMPSHDCIPFVDLANYVEELVEIVQYNFGSWSSEYSYVKDLKNSILKHGQSLVR